MGMKRPARYRRLLRPPQVRIWMDKYEMFHRLSGPAWEHDNGSKQWWMHGIRHRDDGPAIETILWPGEMNPISVNQTTWFRNGVKCMGINSKQTAILEVDVSSLVLVDGART
jgi:hypothetical protein